MKFRKGINANKIEKRYKKISLIIITNGIYSKLKTEVLLLLIF